MRIFFIAVQPECIYIRVVASERLEPEKENSYLHVKNEREFEVELRCPLEKN